MADMAHDGTEFRIQINVTRDFWPFLGKGGGGYSFELFCQQQSLAIIWAVTSRCLAKTIKN
jgi:hypothetical protein